MLRTIIIIAGVDGIESDVPLDFDGQSMASDAAPDDDGVDERAAMASELAKGMSGALRVACNGIVADGYAAKRVVLQVIVLRLFACVFFFLEASRDDNIHTRRHDSWAML